jgi:hypothetical protein
MKLRRTTMSPIKQLKKHQNDRKAQKCATIVRWFITIGVRKFNNSKLRVVQKLQKAYEAQLSKRTSELSILNSTIKESHLRKKKKKKDYSLYEHTPSVEKV